MTRSPTVLERGVGHLQRGEFHAARQCFERATSADPRDAVALNCLGIVARVERRTTDALTHFRRAIELRPGFAEAHHNLGNALRDANQLDEAASCYRQAVSLKPDSPEAHNSLGVVHLTRGAIHEAITCFDEAIRLLPRYAEAHNNLANAYGELGDDIAAVASFGTALQLRPDSPEIHNNLAMVLARLGQWDEAVQHWEHAAALNPEFADAYSNLGNALLERDKFDEAIASYQRAARLQPSHMGPLINLGNAYRLLGQTEQAHHTYARVAALEPQDRWHQLRLASLCPPAFHSRQEMIQRRDLAMNQWERMATSGRARGGWQFSSPLAEPSLNWQFLDGDLRPLKETYARIFGDDFSRETPLRNDGRPRIGLVVTRGHEGLFLRSLRGVIEQLPAREFDLAIVCPRASESALRGGIQRAVECVTFPERFDRSVEAIREARFDCLYHWEIGSDATNYFLPMFRLAPVQVTSWGIQFTSGMTTVDYYLSSQLVEPADAASHYTEQLLLASTLLTYQFRPTLDGSRKVRGNFGLDDSQHVYVCAQQLGKFHPDFDEMLAGILRRDPLGVVVATQDRYGNTANIVRERFVRTIPDVAERIVLLPKLAFRDYLWLLYHADVLLDPPHFGGVNSTYDALALGRPLVTLPSGFHRGRYTAACLRRMGMTECIASNIDEYVGAAVLLATNPDYREAIRRRIQNASEILFHDRTAILEHERLFEYLIEVARGRRSN